jgi:hypothetical protein
MDVDVDFMERSARLGHTRIVERGRRGHPFALDLGADVGVDLVRGGSSWTSDFAVVAARQGLGHARMVCGCFADAG